MIIGRGVGAKLFNQGRFLAVDMAVVQRFADVLAGGYSDLTKGGIVQGKDMPELLSKCLGTPVIEEETIPSILYDLCLTALYGGQHHLSNAHGFYGGIGQIVVHAGHQYHMCIAEVRVSLFGGNFPDKDDQALVDISGIFVSDDLPHGLHLGEIDLVGRSYDGQRMWETVIP